MSQKHIGDYIVNTCTLYIKPVEYGNKLYSHIGEVDEEILCPVKPIALIQRGCAYYGVDFESRRKGTRLLIDYSRKLPIIVEPINHIFAFCTTSPGNPMGIWFFYEQIRDYKRISARETLVIFHNGQSFLFPVSYNTFNTQMLRTSLLKSKFMQRVDYNQKKLFYLLNRPKPSKASESNEFYSEDSK